MAATHRRPRPGLAAHTANELKLHRHRVVLDGREHTVIALRSGADVRFSTNRFHGTWHVLSDWRGAQVLGRLLWGLSYQRREGTLLLIDLPHLDPNPFDAEPADPIVLLPTHLTVLRRQAARQLRRMLPLRVRPEGTVRWRTDGLDREPAPERAGAYRPPAKGWRSVDRIGGLLVLAGGPLSLRRWARDIADLGAYAYYGMDYVDFCRSDGEVQVFRQYRREVSIAREARREVLAQTSGQGLTPERVRQRVWAHAELVRRRRGRVTS